MNGWLPPTGWLWYLIKQRWREAFLPSSFAFSVLPEPQQEVLVHLQPVVQSPQESGAERGRGEYQLIYVAPVSQVTSRPLI